ncbi:MAG: carbon-nitrogen hydrolase [Candidatus Micrarchaeota archaeon]|nr:carbon-nitrogen hydrolase [Candidatus Micrarchaeota archaeon]
MKFKLGLVQMKMNSSKQENIDNAIRMIAEAAKKGASIVCLPELFNSPYFPQDEKANINDIVETIPGPTTTVLSKAAKDNKVVLVGGSIYEKDEKSGKFYNTTPVFDETGKLLGKYRKVHIPHDPNFYEQNYFEPGDLGFQVFKTRNGKLGTLICYDQWFPEAARINALMGADILFYPTAIGTVKDVEQSEGNWQEAWENVQRGHAIANATVVCTVNRVGTEEKMNFWGGSFVIDQFGKTIVRGSNKEEVLVTEIDLDLGKQIKEGWRFFYNRRPDQYKEITRK